MLVVAALGQAGLFDLVMAWLLQKVRDTRTLAAVLVGVCFFAAMLITNDVALITFVPLTLLLPGLGFGVEGVFLAEPISNAVGGLASFLTMWFTLYRKL